MNDDALLDELARLARAERDETAEDDARWAALAAGTLSATEQATLRSEAEASPEAARAIEAYRPLDDGFRARMTALAASAIDETERDDPPDPLHGADADADELPGPNVIDARRRWRRRGPGLALAAALLLAVLWPAASGPPLPDYALQIGGQVAVQRSAEAPSAAGTASDGERRVFADGNRLSLVWTPSTGVADELVARVFALHDGELLPLDLPPAEASEDGALRVEAEIGREVDWPAGESHLVVVVARVDGFPDPDILRARSQEPSPFREADWIAWTIPVLRP